MSRKKETTTIHGVITISQKYRLAQIAKAREVSVSNLMREAVAYYLQSVDNGSFKRQQSAFGNELTALEERLARLLLKTMRGSAETLYMVSQLWVHGGPPKDGLNDQELQLLFDASKQFAYRWITTKDGSNHKKPSTD